MFHKVPRSKAQSFTTKKFGEIKKEGNTKSHEVGHEVSRSFFNTETQRHGEKNREKFHEVSQSILYANLRNWKYE